MKDLQLHDVASAWLRVDVAQLDTDPIQAQYALASVNLLVVYLDKSWRAETAERKRQARKLLTDAVACQKTLTRLASGEFTNGTRASNLGSKAKKQYRDLLRRVLEWCKVASPPTAEYFKSVVLAA
jgi:hypothetical protein